MQATPVLDAAAPPQRARSQGPRIIDAPMRMFHWLFALSFALAYASGDSEHWRLLHVSAGYTMVGLLGWRVVYGLVGPRQARLSVLWRKLAGAPSWLRSLRARTGSVAWRPGQNLAMAAAVLLLLVLTVPLTLSGYASYNEWGDLIGVGDALEEVHEFFGNAMLALVAAHLGLIALLSVLRRRNLALPMLTGRTHGGAGPDLVKRNRGWLAALVLLGVVAFGAWQWQQSPDAPVAAAHVGGTAPAGDDDD